MLQALQLVPLLGIAGQAAMAKGLLLLGAMQVLTVARGALGKLALVRLSLQSHAGKNAVSALGRFRDIFQRRAEACASPPGLLWTGSPTSTVVSADSGAVLCWLTCTAAASAGTM